MAPKTYKSMEDFAKACGVSRPTIAKYFNNPFDLKAATRKRIETVLKQSDFEPNSFVRHLNSKVARNIGIIIPTVYDPFFAQFVSHIETALRERGFWPIQISSHTRPDLEEEAVERMLDFKVSGVIVAPLGNQSYPGVFDRLKSAIPTVSFDVPLGDVPSVSSDHREGITAMVQYLCRSGEPPVLLEGPHLTDNALIRQDGYRDAMREEGHEPLVIDCDFEPSWELERIGYLQMKRLLSAGELPGRTLLCSNDRIAFGVMLAAGEAGLKIGREPSDDLRVAGHDDHPLSRYMWPPLTTMAQDTEAIACETVYQLAELLDAEALGAAISPRRMRIRSTLMMRKSA